jgi:hypothetical protein
VCIGDVVRLGEALVQVSQGRQPCWKLDARFGEPGMAREMQLRGHTGPNGGAPRSGVASLPVASRTVLRVWRADSRAAEAKKSSRREYDMGTSHI